MKKKIRVIAPLFLALIFWGVYSYNDKEADGFHLSKIRHNTFSHISEESLSSLSPSEIDAILNQKFRYLAKGKQSFVFASEDEKFVLKLFNNTYQSRMSLLSHLPSFFSEKKIAYNQKKLHGVEESYRLAFSDLKKETGLLFLHLGETRNLNKKLTLIDKRNRSFVIDLDQTGFLIQRRATSAYPKLQEWLQKGERKKINRALEEIVQLLKRRCQKGIYDKDPLIRTNLGFLEDHPLFLDLGPFSKSEEIKKREAYTHEIVRITTSLKEWLEERDPPSALYLEEELRRQL